MSSPVPQAERIHVELDPGRVVRAHAQHRRRFAEEVAQLDEAALAMPSRCTEWTVADVLRHLCDVDSWMHTLWAGNPLPFTSFDPNTTPHEFVLAGRATPDRDVRDRFVASSESMASNVENADGERWGIPSLSPVGFVPWWLSAMHIFYDSWVHERDALLPVDVSPPVLDDEATPVLAYSLALVGAFEREPLDAVIGGVRVVAGTEPAVTTPVEPTDLDGAGRLIDALNGRDTLADVLTDQSGDTVHRLEALARFFRRVT